MTEKEAPALAKIAWGITGAGHFLPACIEILCQLRAVDVFLTRAAAEVLGDYHLWERLRQSGHNLFWDTGASSRPVTKLYGGRYQTVVIAPVTANSMAKMQLGIADTLVTNLFAHAGKCRLTTILLPCDSGETAVSKTPSGDSIPVYIRGVDRANTAGLAEWPGVVVVKNPAELNALLAAAG